MKLIHGYMNDDALRHELNALTRKTFWFDFEEALLLKAITTQ